MKTSDSIAELATALTKAQSEFDPVYKDGKSYTNKYATLQNMVDTVRPVLKNNGLSFTQMPGASEHIDQIVLTSRLMHSSGQWIEETMTIPVPQVGKANAAQNYGAGLTYARRYSLESMLGIAATEDTDANGPQPQQQPQPHRQSAPPPPPQNGNGGKYGKRPFTAETLKQVMAKKTANDNGTPATDKQRKYAAASLSVITTSDNDRYDLTDYLFGVRSASDLTMAQASAIIDWVEYKKQGDDWVFNEDARQEAARVVKAAQLANGQRPLFDDEPAATGAYAE